MERIQSIRGAISVEENTISAIKEATTRMIKGIIEENNLDLSDIVNISFTMTDDLDEANPATCIRESLSLDSVPMLCAQEMKIKNTMPRCIRTMVQAYTSLTKSQIKHIYLDKASSLRPDLGIDVPGQQKLKF